MFMCLQCHKQDERKYGCFHVGTSLGKCELCDRVEDCVDCMSYKEKVTWNSTSTTRFADTKVSCVHSHPMCEECMHALYQESGE